MAVMKEIIKNEEKTIAELRKTVVDLEKRKEELEKEIKVKKLKLAKVAGIKEEDPKKLEIQQESKKKRDFIVKPIHPGEILREELLIPRDMSPEELAQEIKFPKEIVKGVCEERGDITLDLAKRLSIYFDTSLELGLNLQRSYEEELSEASLESLREEIIPYKEKHANGGKHAHS